MMWRGAALAYVFDGDADAQFEADESLLFYGWAFDGTRDEKHFVNANVYWLWVDSSLAQPTRIETIGNEMGHAHVRTTSAEMTAEPENTFSLTYTRRWDTFPNEFDTWYWQQIEKSADQTVAFDFTVDLADPVTTSDATYLVEVLNRTNTTHKVKTQFNEHPSVTHIWSGQVNTNLTQSVGADTLQHGSNNVAVELLSDAADKLLVNRITVNYERWLRADDNMLHFSGSGGAETFALDGFSAESPLLAWNISNRLQPIAIDTANSYDGEAQQHHIGGTFDTATKWVAVTESATQSVDTISRYNGPNLQPREGAEWLAISHASLLSEAQRLANHRETHSRLLTKVVDVEDVINQYGYGLPIPEALRSYIIDAHTNWSIQPGYVTLIGSATQNPRQLACRENCLSGWTTEDPTLVPTFLIPRDRFLGLMVTDHFYGVLSDETDRQTIAVGRIPVSTLADLTTVVDKIVQYEANLVSAEDWLQNLLFVSDNADGAGNFCTFNDRHITEYADDFVTPHYCLDRLDTETLRDNMFDSINEGVLMAHYLGHGFVESWASEGILTKADQSRFENAGKPFIQISGNCLDGHFGWVGSASISETLLTLQRSGSVAHWGSSGIGYLIEHQIMHTGFTEALQDKGVTRIGDAIVYGKNAYLDIGYYAPQAYSSQLLGDPAMQIAHPELAVSATNERIVEEGARDGDVKRFKIVSKIKNHGVRSTNAVFSQTLSSNAIIESVEVSANASFTFPPTEGSTIVRPHQYFTGSVENLGMQETATITVIIQVLSGDWADSVTMVMGSEDLFEADLENNSAETAVFTNTLVPVSVTLTNSNAHSSTPFALLAASMLLTLLTVIASNKKGRTAMRPIN